MSNAPLDTWLECLRAISSVKGILHVGPGYGVGALSRWSTKFATASVHLIEADPHACSHLHRTLGQKANIRISKEIVTPQEGSWKFHTYDNPSENGLLGLDDVRQLWPQIQQGAENPGKQYSEGIPLEKYIKEQKAINWLIVDCLPATPLIQSAGSYLENMDVVVARSIIREGPDPVGCTVASTTKLLQKLSFRLIHVHSERNPAIGLALYAKDLHATETMLKKRLETLELQNQELDTRLSKQAELINAAERQLEQIKDLMMEKNPG